MTEPKTTQAESESGPYTHVPLNMPESENELRQGLNAACRAGAASRDARVKVLTDALKWTLDWIADGTDASEGETPAHDCEFSSNPEKGACDFHKKYFESVATLSDGEKTGGKP